MPTITESQLSAAREYAKGVAGAIVASFVMGFAAPSTTFGHLFLSAITYGLCFGLIFGFMGSTVARSIYNRSFLVTAFLRMLAWGAAAALAFTLSMTILLWLGVGVAPWTSTYFHYVAAIGSSSILWLSILGTLFAATFISAICELSRKLGPGVLWNWVRGYYHVPRHEERFFMFLDMRNSTSIAEQLGEMKFSALVRDFFADLTNPVRETRGEVSHYIGDEAVLTWTTKNGRRQCACVRCFYLMRDQIESRRDRYLQEYGLVPDFKAGIHYGGVVATEVGRIKSEVVYHGDVLNTAARIQGACETLGHELLMSETALEQAPLEPGYCSKPIGEQALKGKAHSVRLVAIVRSNEILR